MTRRWRRLPRSRVLLAVPVLLTLLIVPFAGVATARPVARSAQGEEPDGEMLYQRDCAVCHGPQGRGTPRGQSLLEVGPAEADYVLTTGRMPISEPGDERRRRPVKYSPEEIEALLDHMRPFLAPEPEIPEELDLKSAKMSEGAELFSRECASCHQWAGQGGALMGREAPALDRATAKQVAEAVRSGPVGMPEFGEELMNEEQLNAVVKYVMYLRAPEDRGGLSLWHLGPFTEGLISWVVGMALLILITLWIGEREPAR